MAYIRKTCAICRKPAHTDPVEDAKCTFDHYISQDKGTEFALNVVAISFGQRMREQIEKLNKAQMNQYFT